MHLQCLRLVEQLPEREQADEHRNEADALGQLVKAEGEAFDPGGQVDADGADQHAEGAGDQVAQRGLAADRSQHGEREDREGEVLRRAELERDRGEQGCRDDEYDQAENPAGDTAEGCDAERPPGLAALGHGIAVERGRHRRRRAGRIDQDRGDRAAEGAGAGERGHHADRRHRIERDRERQQQGDRHRRTQSRQRADQNADQNADEDQHDVVGLENQAEPLDDRFHGPQSPKA
jgi:hypothetical protein